MPATISKLDPNNVPQDWEGVVEIHGTGFDKDSYAIFDGAFPAKTFKSATLLEANIKRDITGKAGVKKVKVHTGAGELSDEKDFEVTAPRS